MKRIPIFIICGFALGLIEVIYVYSFNPKAADFGLKILLGLCTFFAVLVALYGDWLKAKFIPIDIKIEIPELGNNVVDQMLFNGQPHNAYCHHLRVYNLTNHVSLNNCRVWLRKVCIQDINKEWVDKFKFAVPRLMNWAPFEYSPDKRTFCTTQVFDLGTTIGDNIGFILTANRDQGGVFKNVFAVGQNLRCVFFVTADNYLKEEDFCFEINVIQQIAGQPVTPSKISAVNNWK